MDRHGLGSDERMEFVVDVLTLVVSAAPRGCPSQARSGRLHVPVVPVSMADAGFGLLAPGLELA